MADTTRVVLVHGGWHGAWCWERVMPLLDAAGVEATAIDLPFTGLEGDTTAVRAVLDRLEGPAVLCGHSYGGAVITGAGEHPVVRHLIYLAAFLLDETETLVSFAGDAEGSALLRALRIADDGSTTIDAADAVEAFYHDCPAADAHAAVARLRAWPLGSGTTTPTAHGWKTRPATYAVCDDDRAVPVEMQDVMAARAARVVRWPSSHSPFYSRPADVAELLIRVARSVTRSPVR